MNTYKVKYWENEVVEEEIQADFYKMKETLDFYLNDDVDNPICTFIRLSLIRVKKVD